MPAMDMTVMPPSRAKKRHKQSKILNPPPAQNAQSPTKPVTKSAQQCEANDRITLPVELLQHDDEDEEAFIMRYCEEILNRCSKSQNDVVKLQERLEEERAAHQKEKMRIRQELMLDMIKSKDSADKRFAGIQREKYYVLQFADQQKKEADKWKKEANDKRTEHAKVVIDLDYYRTEVEHFQALNKVLEDDLDELRQIENEEAAHRLQKAQGLPPAYGSLNEEENLPPYELHKDSGSFDVAAFKRTVRTNFSRKLAEAEAVSNKLRSSDIELERQSASSNIFVSASIALAESSRTLKAALSYAENALTTHLISHGYKHAQTDFKGIKVQKKELKRYIARRDYVADRVAKILLDLSWRILSATAVRPVVLSLTPHEKARLSLAYKEADECFLEALRNAFDWNHEWLLFDYQHYLTQLFALRRDFNLLRSGVNYVFFNKASMWLEEQVETERMNRANRAVDGCGVDAAARCAVQPAPSANAGGGAGTNRSLVIAERQVNGSEISSEAARTGSDNSSDDVY